MASHKRFRKFFIPAFEAEGDSPADADANVVALMRKVVEAYEQGRRVVDEEGFSILYENDPGSGPGTIRPANLNSYGRDHDDDGD